MHPVFPGVGCGGSAMRNRNNGVCIRNHRLQMVDIQSRILTRLRAVSAVFFQKARYRPSQDQKQRVGRLQPLQLPLRNSVACEGHQRKDNYPTGAWFWSKTIFGLPGSASPDDQV
jgi:hypothetical protein